MFLLASVTFALIITNTIAQSNDVYNAYMIHAEPYAWQNGSKVVGLIPNLFTILSVKCENLSVNVKQVHWSLEELKQITLSKDPLQRIMERENLSSIDKNTIVGMNNYPEYFEAPRQFLAYPFVYTSGIVAVVHRDSIGLGRKLYEAMIDSAIIIYNGILLAAIVGVLIWFVERHYNPALPDTLGPGILHGFWFGMVTMSTVGYGDIVPKTKIGKSLTIIYMMLTTLLMAALTGVYTDRVANSSMNISPTMKMSVVNGTFDVSLAMRFQKNKDHVIDQNNIKKVRTYAEALHLVETKEVDVALIDYNVAAWLQDDITDSDLRIAKHIEQKFHKHIYIYEDHSDHDRIHKLLECFKNNENYFDHATDNFIRPIQIVRLDITDMYHALTNLGITPVMSCLALFTLVVVLLYEMYLLKRKRSKEGVIKVELLATKTKMMRLQLIEKRIDEKFKVIKDEIMSDYRELIEEGDIFFESSLNSTQRSDLFRLN